MIISAESNGSTPLLPKHLEELRRSGLTDETIRACGFWSMTDPKEIQFTLRRGYDVSCLGPCLAFPFFDLRGGRVCDFTRLKPDNPRLEKKRVRTARRNSSASSTSPQSRSPAFLPIFRTSHRFALQAVV